VAKEEPVMVIIFVVLYILTALIVAASILGVIYGIGALVCKNKVSVINNLKWLGLCGIIVAIFFAMIYFSIPAQAEELPDGFYHKVVFIDEIKEEPEEEEVHLYVDDLDHIWSYWESIEEDFEDLDWDREVLALLFIRENRLEAAIDLDCCIERGRIVVLTMWECDEEDPFDDEVVDVYYTSFITW
jgi:hypothetical protein